MNLPIQYLDEGSPGYDPQTQKSIRTWVDTTVIEDLPEGGERRYILRTATYQIVPLPEEGRIPSLEERLEAAETLVNLLLGESE